MISEGKVLFFFNLKQKCKYFLNMCIKKKSYKTSKVENGELAASL